MARALRIYRAGSSLHYEHGLMTRSHAMTRLPEVRMSGLRYDIAVLEPPWGLRCPAKDFAQIVVVRRGNCWFECPTFLPHPFYVGEGGMIVTVGGGTQVWRSASHLQVSESAGSFPSVPLGQFQRDPADALKTELLIGRSPRSANMLIPAFPHAFYVSPAEHDTLRRINAMLDLIDLEAHAGDDLVEREGVIQRAAEIMTIVLARYVKRQLSQENPHWPEMATDVPVMRALQLIETRPARNWTVESLASEVGLGRSAFAERFRALVGDTPVNCLTRTRMQLASAAIRDGKRSVAAIANSIGYLSEPAFIKAFRRHFGITPGRYRASVSGRGAADEHSKSVPPPASAAEPPAPNNAPTEVARPVRRAHEDDLYHEAYV
jgi:AraC-like DNA-binding protein